MAIIQGNAHKSSVSGFYPKTIEGSLRFNDDDSAYLSWTPASAGDRKTWTWSGWVKRAANLGSNQAIFSAGSTQSNEFLFFFNTSDQLRVQQTVSGTTSGQYSVTTQASYRDTSAWYHVVLSFDVANTTIDIYVNGVLQTLSTNTVSNTNAWVNNTNVHAIGKRADASLYFDGYLAEVHFTDGTAYDADAFGELKNGVWVAKTPDVTYGTNGFHLNFLDDTEVEAFNTVLYRGNGGTQSVTGMGFQPDLVWIKQRSSPADNHRLFDSVRGATKYLVPDDVYTETTDASTLTSFDNDGFSLSSNGIVNENNLDFVAWGWKAGDSNVSNTDGSTTATVRANDTYGFSMVAWDAPSSGATTVGHGLSSAPSLVICRIRNVASNWQTWHTSLTDGTYTLFLNSNIAQQVQADAFGAVPTSSVLNIGSDFSGSGRQNIAYCWAEKAGYSKFGSYAGNATSVDLGFNPALILIKRITGTGKDWWMFDNTREVDGQFGNYLYPNQPYSEQTVATAISVSGNTITFPNNWDSSHDGSSSSTYIYAAFADTREAAFWLDQSGNDNDWQPVNLDHNDTVADSPTDNFATLNAVYKGTSTALSNGNLQFTGTASTWNTQFATIVPTTGKWYCEYTIINRATTQRTGIGVATLDVSPSSFGGGTANGWIMYDRGELFHNNSNTGTYSTFQEGDVVSIALDNDSNTVYWYRNNSLMTSRSIDSSKEWCIATNTYSSGIGLINFGQQPFTYTPPTDYLALSTANLPDPVIDPAQDVEPRDYFETFLYTGNGAGLQVGDVIKKPADTITIANSVILDGSNEYFSRTVQSGGSTSEWTISFWFKDAGGILGSDTILGNTDNVIVYFNSSNSYRMTFFMGNSSSQWVMNRLPKDDGMWHHVVLNYDSARSSSDLMRVWFDGVQDSWYSTQVVSAHFTGDGTLSLGARGDGSSAYKGYLAEIHMCDGTAYSASSFGTFDANGIWIPQTPSVTYGTTGFHVNFSDNTNTTTLGADQAGSNDFTYNNGETTDQVADSPTDNFATLDPLNKNSVVTLSDGNLSFTASNNRFVTSTFAVNSGKWYLEFSPTAGGGSGVGVGIILATTDVSGGAGFANSGTYTGVGYTTNGNKYISSVGSAYGDGYGAGNVIGIALDLDSTPQTITFYKDDANQGSINLPTSNQTWLFATDFSHAGTHSINFGQKTFAHTPPTGYLALSENNITVDDQNLESPDFVWIKCRDNTRGHLLFDSVRGIQRSLRTNTNGAEDTSASAQNTLTSFNANGFTIGSDSDVNTAGEDFVAWNWKAGTSFSNSAGTNGASIASSGSANTTSGFSIVSYTGDSTGTDGTPSTVAHGLSQAPEMIMFKPLDTYDGAVYHSGLTSASYRLVLFSASGTLAQASDNGFFNGTAPTSSVFSIGSRKHTNSNGGMIAYCFHSVDGFSKFGTYEGTNNANGPYIYLGFKPKFFLLKNIDSALQWIIFDGERDPFNVVGKRLFPATTNGDSPVPSNSAMDFTSNGVKIRIAGGYDVNDVGTYIYMAFAQNPFKYSNAR